MRTADTILAPCTLSVIIPCYNEVTRLRACVERLQAVAAPDLRLELLLVDDGSTDGSTQLAQTLAQENSNVRLSLLPHNLGKGAALRRGLALAGGDYVAVHDADLEYDPQDLVRMLDPLRREQADVVLGSRFLSPGVHRVLYFWHAVGNKFLTLVSNIFTDLNLTDIECCHKLFRREVIQALPLRENRFGVVPEIIARLARKDLRIYEMGVSYYGRTYREGKKIRARDGLRALYCIVRYSLFP